MSGSIKPSVNPNPKPLTLESEEFRAHMRLERRKIKNRKERHRKAHSKNTITVEAHERVVGFPIGGQTRKDVLWCRIVTLCKAADEIGVSARDRQWAKELIPLIEDTFLTGKKQPKYVPTRIQARTPKARR